MFVQGREYPRIDLYKQFGGQGQGGISTPAKVPLIQLFTGEVYTGPSFLDRSLR